MGKVKQMLIDTPLEDQTDPRDTGDYGEPEQTEPTQAEWAVIELVRASANVINNAQGLTVGDLKDITEVIENLQDLAKHIRKPF